MSRTVLKIEIDALDTDIETIANLWNYEENKIVTDEVPESKADFVTRNFMLNIVKPHIAVLMKQTAQKQAMAAIETAIQQKISTIDNSLTFSSTPVTE